MKSAFRSAFFILGLLVVFSFQNCSSGANGGASASSASQGTTSNSGGNSGTTTGNPGFSAALPIFGAITLNSVGTAVTLVFPVQNATTCSLPDTNEGTVPVQFELAVFHFTGGIVGSAGYVGSNILTCTGPAGTAQATYAETCQANSSSCLFYNPIPIVLGSPLPAPGPLTVTCNGTACTALFSGISNSTACFYPGMNETNGVAVQDGQAAFNFTGVTTGSSGYTGSASFLCVGPGGSTTKTYTATCGANVSIADCQYGGPF